VAVGGAGMAPAPPAVMSPSGPAAELYATQVEAAVAGDALGGQIASEIDSGRRKRGQVPLVRDGRLDRVARDIVRAAGGCRVPAPEAVGFLLWHYGVVAPEPNLFLHCGDDGAETTALAAMRSNFAGAKAAPDWRRVGIGVERTAGRWSAAIIFQEKHLDLEPVPRTLAPGAHATLAFRLRAAFHRPEVLVTPPRGTVVRQEATSHRDGHTARLDCDRGNGAYQVEIIAQDERGPRVLANFPVYCGVAGPTTFTVAAPLASSTLDPEAIERQLLELMDRDRGQAGLSTFVRDARLAAAARRYSREMAETGEVAHVSPRTGSVVDRVRKAGVEPPPTAIMENVGSATSAGDAEHAFMGSPGHRDNILSPLVTHVGVGVAVGRDEGGTAILYFTQIFVGWGK